MNRKNRSKTIIALLSLLMTISVIGYSKKTSADGTITEISLQQIQSIEVTTNQSIEVAQSVPETQAQITKAKKEEPKIETPTPDNSNTTTEVSNAPASAPKTATKETWERIAACESGGNWQINTGNGYYGGLQFSATTWRSAGGTKYAPLAHLASKDQQIEIADAWLAKTSWSQWGCAARLGIS
jgi:hypothetical protein